MERRGVLCPEVAITVLLRRCRAHIVLLLRWLGRQYMCRILVRRVDVRLRRCRHLNRVLSFIRLDNAQVCIDLVIALRSLRNIAV